MYRNRKGKIALNLRTISNHFSGGVFFSKILHFYTCSTRIAAQLDMIILRRKIISTKIYVDRERGSIYGASDAITLF